MVEKESDKSKIEPKILVGIQAADKPPKYVLFSISEAFL